MLKNTPRRYYLPLRHLSEKVIAASAETVFNGSRSAKRRIKPEKQKLQTRIKEPKKKKR